MAVESLTRGRIELVALPERLIEITMTDYMEPEAVAYIPRLEALMRAQGGKVSLLFSLLALNGYHRDFPIAHVAPFRSWMTGGQLHKVAVVHTLPSVRFAIATVSLASQTNIKGFSTRQAGIDWVRSTVD